MTVTPSQAEVTAFFHAESSTWMYLVAERDSGAALVIDVALDFDAKAARTGTGTAQAILEAIVAKGYRLQWILETHAHADHLSAGAWLRQQLPSAKLGIGEGIRQVQASFKPIFNFGEDFATDGSQFDHLFADGESFMLGSIACEVIATPGHTNDSVSYRIGDALFVGDSLFMPDAGTARCDFPGGDAGRLYHSIQRLFALADDTRVFVCHDYGPGGRAIACESSIGAQRQNNIHVHEGTSEADYVKLRKARDATLAVPALLLPSVQVNIRAGELPPPEANGTRYLKLPLDTL